MCLDICILLTQFFLHVYTPGTISKEPEGQWTESRRYGLNEITVLKVGKFSCEVRMGKRSDSQVRQINFQSAREGERPNNVSVNGYQMRCMRGCQEGGGVPEPLFVVFVFVLVCS